MGRDLGKELNGQDVGWGITEGAAWENVCRVVEWGEHVCYHLPASRSGTRVPSFINSFLSTR